MYLRGRQRVAATGKVAIIVDDGLATGLTMFLAIKEVRRQNPSAVIVAVPVAPANTVARLQSGQPGAGAVDAVEVLYIPQTFAAIGAKV